MPGAKFLPLVLKYLTRHRGRSILTLAGVATAMFLFSSVQAIQEGVRQATERSADETKLVVYRQDRYCPFTSNLPQDYGRKIAEVPGVKHVVPVRILVSNCRTSLDVVTFRGIPPDTFDSGAFKHVKIVDGSMQAWERRNDAVLINERVASRKGLKTGDRVEIAGVTIFIAGIFESPEPQDQNVGYAHLDFIQRAGGNNMGLVTQFDVLIDDPKRLDTVAEAIDAEFASAAEPTTTWSEKGFVSRAASDVVEIVRFMKWLGWGCIIGVFALVFNAVVLSVQERIKDHAIMQTLGYPNGLIASLIIAESTILSLTGGVLGVLIGLAVMHWGRFSLSVEGLSISVHTGAGVTALGLTLSALTGIIAGLVPAWQASRRDIAECFRAV